MAIPAKLNLKLVVTHNVCKLIFVTINLYYVIWKNGLIDANHGKYFILRLA